MWYDWVTIDPPCQHQEYITGQIAKPRRPGMRPDIRKTIAIQSVDMFKKALVKQVEMWPGYVAQAWTVQCDRSNTSVIGNIQSNNSVNGISSISRSITVNSNRMNVITSKCIMIISIITHIN